MPRCRRAGGAQGDRGLVRLQDELGLLVAHSRVSTKLQGLFEKQMARIIVPENRSLRPHPAFVRRHRERFAA